METRKGCSSSGTRTIRVGRAGWDNCRVQVADVSATTGESWRPWWKLLWRKLFKEKRQGVPKPDEYTNPQNFDEGSYEIDSLEKSFSVRCADPTIIFFREGDT
ncbi:hypothetical protein RHGRI_000760 [Rhododendron griersonianum]|uniref:Uncharacterized protein n=1 Tax=Rhododendron griersonianum TaxID=479676 RepID=A0AAV6LIZ4_9ERIC|nr:hypothetical protein RHGRI_000760 [Rhododendron griersonianum]